jgi:DNA-binding GntR family transcriptional regulator
VSGLNDDEFTGWLGVSRTPVREAIARLVARGFVGMATNRYTKVSARSSAEYGYARDFLAELHQIVLDGADTVNAALRADAAAQAKKAAGGLERQQLAAYGDLLDAFGVLTAGLENPLFTDAERSARGRARFHAVSFDVTIDLAAATEQAGALVKL